MAGQADSLKSILFALFANGAIALAKGIAAFITGSGAMLAEAVHSVADAGNQLLLILGLRQTKKVPTEDHPLGFGKSIYFWSFLVAMILFSLGGMFSVYEGVHKLLHPIPLSHPWIAIAVLAFAIAAESVSLWGCMREVNKERHGRNLFQWFRHSRSSALLVVFGEDVAALFGLVFALLAITVTFLTGNPLWDAVGTIAIGVLLIVRRRVRGGRSQGTVDRAKRGAGHPGRDGSLPARPSRGRGTVQPADHAVRARRHGGGQGAHGADGFGAGADRNHQRRRARIPRAVQRHRLAVLRPDVAD
jgi:cation diffusion facilitator family transporter